MPNILIGRGQDSIRRGLEIRISEGVISTRFDRMYNNQLINLMTTGPLLCRMIEYVQLSVVLTSSDPT